MNVMASNPFPNHCNYSSNNNNHCKRRKSSSLNSVLVIPKDNDLFQRLGGENIIDFAIATVCERIMEDSQLKSIYAIIDDSSNNTSNSRKKKSIEDDNEEETYYFLPILQKEIFLAAISSKSDHHHHHDHDHDDNCRGRLALKHIALIQQGGLQQRHLNQVTEFFEEALQDCWVEQDVIDGVMKCLKSFQFLDALDIDPLSLCQ